MWVEKLCIFQREARYLICPLGFTIAVKESSLNSSTYNGQAFACFKLIGQREQAGLLHILLSIHAHQHQDLRPCSKQRTTTPQQISGKIIKRKKQTGLKLAHFFHMFKYKSYD